MTIAFTVMTGTNTREIQLRVQEIANGWVVKAGGPPYFCKTRDELKFAIICVLDQFMETK